VRPGGRSIAGASWRGSTRATVEARDVTTGCRPTASFWTNDNLVALQTLLDEKDSDHPRLALPGKVDLVYIDPPSW